MIVYLSNGHSFHWSCLSRQQLLRSSCHPQAVEAQAPSPLHRIDRTFRPRLIAWPIPAFRERRGTFIGQCCRPLCSGDTANHPDGPRVVTEYRLAKGRSIPWGFSWLGSVARHPGRNATPPELTPPGPFVTRHCFRALATYLLCGKFERSLPNEFGPAQVGFDFIRSS